MKSWARPCNLGAGPGGIVLALLGGLFPAPQARTEEARRWGAWVEADFPFVSSVVDARSAGDAFPSDNLTPRGLVLNLGHGLWACFDTDLLRWSAVWAGEAGQAPLTPDGLAPGSYHVAGQKTKDGQEHLPKPVGRMLLANGLYPGVQGGAVPGLEDPREPAPSPGEPGRGPLAGAAFLGVSLPEVTLRYTVDGGTEIAETLRAGQDGRSVRRRLEIAPGATPLTVIVGLTGDGVPVEAEGGVLREKDGVRHVVVPPGDGVRIVTVRLGPAGAFSEPPVPETWAETVTTRPRPTAAGESAGYGVEDLPLPLENPWKRNVRLADLGFFREGRNGAEAAAVTFDGDVWLLGGLGETPGGAVTWRRFASGLLEPMSLVIRDGEIFVFDRHGIWRLRDRDGDGVCDDYGMFCNRFAQTAETREFPNSMDVAPDGSFVIAKGGQEGTTRGKDNGSVLRISADGRTVTKLGYGLRQPFAAVDPETGRVTASDQQGQYVPSTPLQVIRDGRFYGHLPHIAPEEAYPGPIEEPAAWIPHPVNPSGATQVWLRGSRLGPVDGDCFHLGYNRPELFRVLFSTRFRKPQATVTGFARGFDVPLLNGAVNPADGLLYLTGFQVWGTTAPRLSGLVRLRHDGRARVLLRECTPTDQGILLRFSAPLDAETAGDPANFSAERWNYRRSPKYGSPHLRPDGTPGQEWMTPSSAYLSADGQAVFVGLPDMRAGVHQMRIGWGIRARDGGKVENVAYFSPWELVAFDPVREGFGDIRVDLAPRPAVASASPAARASAEEGERLSVMMGCVACHSTDGTTAGKVGPSWKGLAGSTRVLAVGAGPVRADDAYLRESILNPGAKVPKGFEKFDTGMPIYEGILNPVQVESLVLYLKTLGGNPEAVRSGTAPP